MRQEAGYICVYVSNTKDYATMSDEYQTEEVKQKISRRTGQPVRDNVVSIRVPAVEVAMIDRLARAEGLTRTDWVLKNTRTAVQDPLPPNTGVDRRTMNMLKIGGTVFVGTTAYSSIYHVVDKAVDQEGKKRFSREEANLAAGVTATVIALLGMSTLK